MPGAILIDYQLQLFLVRLNVYGFEKSNPMRISIQLGLHATRALRSAGLQNLLDHSYGRA